LEPGLTRDVHDIRYWGTGELEITIKNATYFEKARPLLDLAYIIN
jgi:predicted transport protein